MQPLFTPTPISKNTPESMNRPPSASRAKLLPINTKSGFLKWAIAAGLVGSCGGLALEIAKPNKTAAIAQEPTPLVSLENLDLDLSNAPQPQLQKSFEKDPALTATVDTAKTGTAQSYTEAGDLIDVADIDPHKTQAEQGINDKSGWLYPCVFSGSDQDVCQRYLTPTEATAAGY